MPVTPGPWKVHNDAPHGLLVMQDDSVGICRLWQDSFCPADPMANALLIAAAPDLLAALKGLVGVCQELCECSRPEYIAAWDALARVEKGE